MERPGSRRRGRRASGRPHSWASSPSHRGHATGFGSPHPRPETRSSACGRSSRTSGEQDRRQPLAPVDGGLVGGAPGLEELNQLLARAVVVPFAIAPDDLEQIVDRLLAVPFAVQAEREIEPRLMVERIGRDLLFEVGDGPNRFRLLGDFERRAGGGDRGVVGLGFRHQGERLLRLLGGAGAHEAAREAGERGDVAAVLRQHLGVEIGGAPGSAPRKPSTGWPLTKANTAGIDWMPSCPGIVGCLSMSILTSFTLPLAARTTFSNTGPSCLHGPHHSAQKSTSTGWRLDSSITSLTKVWVVVSLTTLLGAAPSPLCNIVISSVLRPCHPRRRASAVHRDCMGHSMGPCRSRLKRAPPRRKPEYGQLNGVNGGVCNR